MAKAVAGPGVITANRLHDGAVVYLTADGGWSEHIAAALVASAEALAAVQPAAQNTVVDVTTISADLSLREKIRLTGPTVRPDLARVTGA